MPNSIPELAWIMLGLVGGAAATIFIAYIKGSYVTKEECRSAQANCAVCRDLRVMRKAMGTLITYNQEIPDDERRDLIRDIMPS